MMLYSLTGRVLKQDVKVNAPRVKVWFSFVVEQN